MVLGQGRFSRALGQRLLIQALLEQVAHAAPGEGAQLDGPLGRLFPSKKLRLSLEVVLHGGMKIEVVLAQVRKPAYRKPSSAHASQLQRMRPSEEPEAYNALFSDLVALEQARRELNDRASRA